MLFIAYLASIAPQLLQHTVVIDPYFDNGALQHSWPRVRSNTTWNQFIESLRRFSATANYAQQIRHLHPSDEPTYLHVLAKSLREAISPYLHKIHKIKGYVEQLNNTSDSVSVLYKKSSKTEYTIQAEKVIFSPGSSPKIMSHSLPTIPLHVGLDNRQLGDYVSAGESVVLFGLAHSGVLILKNLADLNCRVSAIYNTDKPFLFARDGEYDGIKQDAALVADDVLVGKMPNVELLSWSSHEEVQDALLRADWVIYSIGFENSTNVLINNGPAQKYEPKNAMIAPNIYGFGIAYPSFSEIDGRKFWDVSIPSFTDHILSTNILSTVSSE
jgi:hypothetical protein